VPGVPGYVVVGKASGAAYHVTEAGACSCPDYQHRCRSHGLACKHRALAELHRSRNALHAVTLAPEVLS